MKTPAITELRIGNYIQFEQEVSPSIVRGIAINGDIHLYGVDGAFDASLFECSGIPLTPEILEKCGAREDFASGYGGWLINLGNSNSAMRLKHSENIGYYWWTHCNNAEINYLHQLQNLYFALTGNELTIKS